MFIKELFERATHEGYLDLQALIMFLVFEKKVLDMEDSADELYLYYQEKHSNRMNNELIKYKEKMNMKYGFRAFEVTGDGKTSYIAAFSEEQARYIAQKNLLVTEKVRWCRGDKLMTYKGKDVTLGSVLKGRKAGILGGF